MEECQTEYQESYWWRLPPYGFDKPKYKIQKRVDPADLPPPPRYSLIHQKKDENKKKKTNAPRGSGITQKFVACDPSDNEIQARVIYHPPGSRLQSVADTELFATTM